jgi:glutathione S-transferase
MFTLYTTPLSSNGRKPLALCHHLGLSPEIETVNVYKGEGRAPSFLAVNPLGKVPALVDGDLVLWESNAILTYIADAYGGEGVWPRDPRQRADVARWLFWESAHWQPGVAAVPGLVKAVAWRLGVPGAQARSDEVAWGDARFAPVVAFLEGHLRGRRFLAGAGDALTLADFSVAAMLTFAHATRFPFDKMPAIAAWYARVEALDAWKACEAEVWRRG